MRTVCSACCFSLAAAAGTLLTREGLYSGTIFFACCLFPADGVLTLVARNGAQLLVHSWTIFVGKDSLSTRDSATSGAVLFVRVHCVSVAGARTLSTRDGT